MPCTMVMKNFVLFVVFVLTNMMSSVLLAILRLDAGVSVPCQLSEGIYTMGLRWDADTAGGIFCIVFSYSHYSLFRPQEVT